VLLVGDRGPAGAVNLPVYEGARRRAELHEFLLLQPVEVRLL
jgi:hypothetical protein